MTRAALLTLSLGLLVACTGGGTNPPAPPPPPPPSGTLMKLELSLKPIPVAELKTRPPKPDELWVGKGQTVILKITAQQLSPLTKKARIVIEASGAYLGVTPTDKTINIGESLDLSINLDAAVTEPQPYFFVQAYPIGENDRRLDQMRVDYKWDVTNPPAVP
jgi:hypothetical protein